MSDKSIIWLGVGLGSTIGGFVPQLWHAGLLSMWSILFSGIGGVAGIWMAYHIKNY